MTSNEPILRRLGVLSDHYGEFSQNPDARILRWLLQPDEIRIVEAFVATEEDEHAGEHADVFITLKTAFENPHAHGYVLRQELVTAYQEGREAIAESGVNADWNAPLAQSQERDIAFLMRTCSSLIQHYAIGGHAVLVLRPESVLYPDTYQHWLQRFALEARANVRIMVLDDAIKPAYGPLAAADKLLVRTCEPRLNMPAALEEISQAAGNFDNPGGQFRQLLVKLTKSIAAGDLAGAASFGDSAVGIATAQRWYHLAVPVQFALGAALCGAERHQEALVRYQAAEAAAVQGETDGPEEARAICPQLRLQARLGYASTLIAAGAWRPAAQLYEEIAPLAAAEGDARVTLDCFRLASFCHEQNGALDEAFRVGLVGMPVARQMDKETLETSTFPYLGEALMRLTQSGARRGLGPRMEQEIVDIAGTREWRPKKEADATAAASPAVPLGVLN